MRENTAYLYGQLTRDPICYKNPSTQELLSGQITIKTARRTNATGELFVKGRLRIDFITIYAQRVQDLKDNRTEIENQYLRTMTAKAYVSAKILPVHDAILEKVKTLRSEASKPKKEQDFEKVKKLERMIVQDVREYKGIYERYGVQALALHASNLEKAYDKNDPFLDESRYKETYETQTRWIKEFGPEEDTEVDKD